MPALRNGQICLCTGRIIMSITNGGPPRWQVAIFVSQTILFLYFTPVGYGRITLAAPAIVSTMLYILETVPTASFSFNP